MVPETDDTNAGRKGRTMAAGAYTHIVTWLGSGVFGNNLDYFIHTLQKMHL